MTAPASPSTLFADSTDFDPTGDFDSFLKRVPARGAVYLLADAAGRPVQLLCVRNLRNSVKRRLAVDPNQADGPSRRINYRELVRQVYWRRVDGPFETDWVYHEVARALFPQAYRGMVGMRAAWFVHVNPDAPFPRYTKTTQLDRRDGVYVGPLEEKGTAAKAIQIVEDAFDLCRYYEILTQAPTGRACATRKWASAPPPATDRCRWSSTAAWSDGALTHWFRPTIQSASTPAAWSRLRRNSASSRRGRSRR